MKDYRNKKAAKMLELLKVIRENLKKENVPKRELLSADYAKKKSRQMKSTLIHQKFSKVQVR